MAKGRLVWNHSTHLPGLIPVLERLAEEDGIQTITPAVLSRARSNANQMRLRVLLKSYQSQRRAINEARLIPRLMQHRPQAVTTSRFIVNN